MTTQGFVRRLRVAPPRMPGGEVNLQPPPDVPRVIPGKLLMKLMPFVMIVAVVGMIALMVTVGGRDLTRNPMFLMYPDDDGHGDGRDVDGRHGGRSGKAAAELNEERKDYFSYLANLREDADKTADEQRAAWSGATPTRARWPTWRVPAGCGNAVPPTRTSATSEWGSAPTDWRRGSWPPRPDRPKTSSRCRLWRCAGSSRPVRWCMRCRPRCRCALFPASRLKGTASLSRQLVRSMLLELCTFHGPDHVQVAVVTANPDGENWSWVKWLPQAQHPTLRDGMGSMRLLFPSLELLEKALSSDLAERGRFTRNAEPNRGCGSWWWCIDDGYVTGDERLVTDAGLDSVTVLDLTGPPESSGTGRVLQLVVESDNVGARTRAGVERFATPDRLSMDEAAGHGSPARPLPPGQRRAHRQRRAGLPRHRPWPDGVVEDP